MSEDTIETTLGRPITREGEDLVLNLVDLPVFRGLSVLSRALGEIFDVQAQDARVDVSIERAIRPSENPELRAEFGLNRIRLHVERELARRIARDRERLQDCLRTILGTLQRPQYRDALFATGETPSCALVFRLDVAQQSTRFVLECIPSRNTPGERALRLTIEDPRGRRLDLSSLPHLEVEELEQRVFVAGSTRIAQTLADGMRREAEVGRRRHSERRRPWQHVFEQLDKAGLEGFEEVLVSWSDEEISWILESEPSALETVTKQVLLALEDLEVRRLVRRGECLRVATTEISAWIETSQLERVLHISLGRRRRRPAVEAFLARMPALGRIVEEARDAQPLRDVSVYLVHHITSEVIGTIAALRELGCRDLTVAFVAYASSPPGDWLAALLDLPDDEFRCFALMHLPSAGSVEGRYTMSPRYSRLPQAADLDRALGRANIDYLRAMRTVTLPTFFQLADRARDAGRRCLLIEDGGYVAPVLHGALGSGQSVGAVLAECGVDSDDTRPVSEVLGTQFVGSVEHTRNGYQRLVEVEAEHGGYAFPSFSIAISKHKIETESSEVAVSVLHAIECLLHADGKILSRRNPLILGSRGAIGGRVCKLFRGRLTENHLLGVDLAAAGASENPDVDIETKTYAEQARADRMRVDLVIGITGDSVLQGADIEEWLLEGDARELLLVSGSTKTVEFRDLAVWLDGLLGAREARIGKGRVQLSHEEVVDPQTERVYGDRWRFGLELEDGTRRDRSIVFAAHMTPINFLFYGVATEMIDEVLAELVSTSLGLLRRGGSVEPGLYAVDREIDARGCAL